MIDVSKQLDLIAKEIHQKLSSFKQGLDPFGSELELIKVRIPSSSLGAVCSVIAETLVNDSYFQKGFKLSFLLNDESYHIASAETVTSETCLIENCDKSPDNMYLLIQVRSHTADNQNLLENEWLPAGIEIKKEKDKQFLQKIWKIVLQHLDDSEFTVNDLAPLVGMSYSGFHKKLKHLVNRSPSSYVRFLRLAQAYIMLKDGEESQVSQIAYAVGFRSLSYFSKCFIEEFRVKPSELVRAFA